MNTPEYDVKSEPLVISKVTMDILLQRPEYEQLIALYCFYYYTAKWQQTDQPKATNGYVSQGIHWSKVKVMKYKQILEEIGLIKNIVKHDAKGLISGHYIKVLFFWVSPNSNANPQCGLNHTMVPHYPNALEVIKENASKVIKKASFSSQGSEKDGEEALNENSEQEIPSSKASFPNLNPNPERDASCATVPECPTLTKYPTDRYNVFVYVLWKQKCGGRPRGNLKEIKELCGEYGVPTVEKSFKCYLDETEAKYVSLQSFCSKFGVWLKQSGGPILSSAEKAARDAILYAKPRDQTID